MTILRLDLTICIFFNSPSEGCRNLEHLNLSWCDQITKDGIEALVKGCNGLKALFLRGCTQVYNCLDDPSDVKHVCSGILKSSMTLENAVFGVIVILVLTITRCAC